MTAAVLRGPHSVTELLARRLVQGLVSIGDRRSLQVFTATNGAALLDWTATEHRVLTAWLHERGVELRVGVALHVLVPVESEEDVDELLEVIERVVVNGTWYETYLVDRSRGTYEVVDWHLGGHGSRSNGRHTAPRPKATGLRIHHRGKPWGRPAGAPDEPPA